MEPLFVGFREVRSCEQLRINLWDDEDKSVPVHKVREWQIVMIGEEDEDTPKLNTLDRVSGS